MTKGSLRYCFHNERLLWMTSASGRNGIISLTEFSYCAMVASIRIAR